MPILGNKGKGTKKKQEPIASDTQNKASISAMSGEPLGGFARALQDAGVPINQKPPEPEQDAPLSGFARALQDAGAPVKRDTPGANTPLTSQEFYAPKQGEVQPNALGRAIERRNDPMGALVREADLAGAPRPTDMPTAMRAQQPSGFPAQTVLQNPTPSKKTRTRRRTGAAIGVKRGDKLG
jgi:hypothetical protein